ncbi:unnamed protein product [Cochlearia groenlandica]
MKRKCRIWLPKQLKEEAGNILLFGWFIGDSSSLLDVVVAFSSDESSFYNGGSMPKNVLNEANENMPSNLRDKATFTLLGCYDIRHNVNGSLSNITIGRDSCSDNGSNGRICRYSSLSCGYRIVDGLDCVSSHWIHLVHDSSSEIRLNHIHWNGEIVSQCDVHVIVYDTPLFGSHHFSSSFGNSSPQTKAPLKKPIWVDDLHKRQPMNEMETVILSLNCASASKIAYKKISMQLETSSRNFSISYFAHVLIFRISSLIWRLLATVLASLSSLYYSLTQFFYLLSSLPISSRVLVALMTILKNTWVNFRIRSCQIMYWPIFLEENDNMSISCVEHAEKASLQRHSTWSSMVIDLVLGNIIGLSLLFNTESVSSWILNFAKDFTNDILRSGCVWLMGVPAGFKLNVELAEVLGMVSLNVIQIWSTALWILASSYIVYLVRAIAVLGITFGATVSAAFVIDVVTFATFHIMALHWVVTVLYSHQIQALAALWRLFRGRKLNPLRQRLDSYGYTVKQHVVGSLLFTPLLLLLPTTSVFYIFFTITTTTINSISMLIELAISLIHATPYAEVTVWFTGRKRFPSGVWFERKESSVSCLRNNYLGIGQMFLPHYTTIFSGITASSLTTSARGILSGKRMPSKLGLDLPPRKPWIHMPLRQYWLLCCKFIVSSAKKL